MRDGRRQHTVTMVQPSRTANYDAAHAISAQHMPALPSTCIAGNGIHLVKQLVGLSVEAASVQREHAVGAACQVGVLNQSHVLCTREGNADVAAKGLQGLHGWQAMCPAT